MPVCPLTLDPLPDGTAFSAPGLRAFHPRLTGLLPLNLTHEEQLRQARLRADKRSIQGVQPKLSAVLRVAAGRFEVVDTGGRLILKPNPLPFEEVPANEALTMTMAGALGIEVPPHGLVPAIDGSWVYVIRRFDREGRDRKLHVEDFAQLTGATRDTKYDGTLERVIRVVETHCTFPALERERLARRLLFCFLTGNEDMHLKNFSFIVRRGRVLLAPAYDLLNSTLVLENATEESALPLNGKKRKLNREDWIDYLSRERLGLPEPILADLLDAIRGGRPNVAGAHRAFLSDRKTKGRLPRPAGGATPETGARRVENGGHREVRNDREGFRWQREPRIGTEDEGQRRREASALECHPPSPQGFSISVSSVVSVVVPSTFPLTASAFLRALRALAVKSSH